ncbi:MAG: sulfatase-like hydrolase/transferase [Saprospiraceae bacterium]|nr:sulfatase-like hydrolase/transferase [Saprospiraceae bacterium]
MIKNLKIGCITVIFLLNALLGVGQVEKSENGTADNRPNILFMIADDMSMKDWGSYGGEFAKTLNIDKVAKEGIRFTNAFASSPVCHPARSVLLTSQDIWRLRDAAVFAGTLHQDFEIYPDLLKKAVYQIAHQGKGWGPGWLSPDDLRQPLTGKEVVISQFLKNKNQDEPFCFWWGTNLGQRPFKYEPDGRDLSTIELPPYTFLEAAGLEATEDMTGQNFLSILESDKSGTIESQRDKVYLGLESHPMTGLFDKWLGYISSRRSIHVTWPTRVGYL